jgi:hypothetical protein
MEFVGHTEIAGAFARLRQGRRLYCAVAFWGRGAADSLGLPRVGQGLKIICNLSMGGTNPTEIRLLLGRGAKVKQFDTLHAKVYIGDDEMLVTSANASNNGLGFEGLPQGTWIEAGAIGPVQPQALKWFKQLWSEARQITQDDLRKAALAWEHRQRNLPTLRSFGMFDLDAQTLPLLDWYEYGDFIPDKAGIARQLGQAYSEEVHRRLSDAIDVFGPKDKKLLTEGRWVLTWCRTKGVRAKVGRVALLWQQLGPFIKAAYRPAAGEPTVDVRLPAERPGPVPFDAAERKFRAAFVHVLESADFDELRVGEFDGPWNTAERTRLLLPFWRQVKDTYLSAP